ncbi:helix-turn-helix domain-containing protein [Streptomyces sp. NPDC051561]|uniref:helix-turn-helix domain-containing protein n=1 Tax=Streptomyces sp. NPDC051561 TaxID=3365658 RepID=UPI0037B4F2A6
MTILTLPQQNPADHDRTGSPGSVLPAPAVRRLLREEWGLTRRQVAEAFGVTAATVRSWETGRTSPVGRRRVGYTRFLTGLAEAKAVGEAAGQPGAQRQAAPGGPGECVKDAGRSARSRGFPALPGPLPVTAVRPLAVSAVRPLPVSAVRPLPVGPVQDPVSPLRRRRMRNALIAAGVWCAVLHQLLATGLPPH